MVAIGLIPHRRQEDRPVLKPEPDTRRLVELMLYVAGTLCAESTADARDEPGGGYRWDACTMSTRRETGHLVRLQWWSQRDSNP